jgi:hypothetical protein
MSKIVGEVVAANEAYVRGFGKRASCRCRLPADSRS